MYKLDMHVHTMDVSYCGKVSSKELVNLYKKIGYDGIVITDHYYKGYFDNLTGLNWEGKIDSFMTGYRRAFEEGNRIGLNVIPGMEITFTEAAGDYLVYGIDEYFLKEYHHLFDLGLVKFRELMADIDIFIYQAHPFRQGFSIADLSLIDGIEVFNGNPRHNSNNRLAYEFAGKNNLGMVSGSDFHQIDDLGTGGIYIPDNIKTSEELALILKENRILKIIGAVEV